MARQKGRGLGPGLSRNSNWERRPLFRLGIFEKKTKFPTQCKRCEILVQRGAISRRKEDPVVTTSNFGFDVLNKA